MTIKLNEIVNFPSLSNHIFFLHDQISHRQHDPYLLIKAPMEKMNANYVELSLTLKGHKTITAVLFIIANDFFFWGLIMKMEKGSIAGIIPH
jgi:hypothetical protein